MSASVEVVIDKQIKATAVVLVSAGTALAACGGEAQPNGGCCPLPVKRVNRHNVRKARKVEVNRLYRHAN